MKRFVVVTVLLGVMGMAVFAQNTELPRLAVVEFTTNNNADKTKQDVVTVRNIVESQMVSTGRYQVISRADIDKLLENQRIQVSSISSTENIKKLQLQNISYIVTGAVDAMGDDYAVTVRILDVSTGLFPHSANAFMGGGSRELYTGINTLAGKFISGMDSSEGAVVQNTQSGGQSVKYKVGDTGPGGGTIFQVEGNTCWEVSRNLGSYNWSAAKTAASSFRGGGFSDWYLPSKEELNLIYLNLQKARIMNLGSDWYWSSSQRNNYGAWLERFSDGGQDTNDKKDPYSVRAVRAF
jgi:hypothetical protein